ncbi:L-histidine N(alpha)-methyltransferase [Autumnicola musiva]|uniref:L-histidine N(Alpha)-methyltransferase n=1 Tax=Autumnicola musiva TaxID=3075589 RepID=A0ABU3D6H7_9FLAO|nr:L-histidine N(alpha)-methyltransferase [Zunongwangia sp. F117]MDT0677123.1 L-histidine N(alpha)-methyltransferase [Zunongwangia sp. F117]
MKSTPMTEFDTAFAEDTFKGLINFPKYLLSKYIYNEKGDKLFQKIMEMPEYYLTNCEKEILEEHTAAIADSFNGPQGFDIIELGAGDGKKTKILLRHLAEKKYNFTYQPVDISQHVLDELEETLAKEMPQVEVKTQQGTYFKTLERLADYNTRKKIIMVLGSNIGNLLHKDAINFLKNIQNSMSADDMLFMGFDQKKHPQKILNAYNDPAGITEAFNKNHLERINIELEADFDTKNFLHWESYNPETGTAKSFLVSKIAQKVNIKKLDLKVSFEAWETIHTEISQKYDDAVVDWLASEAGLAIENSFSDGENYYKNYVFRKSNQGNPKA